MTATVALKFSESSRLAWVERGLGVGLTGIMLWLGVVSAVDSGPLWRDEVHTLNIATKPTLADVYRTLSQDSSPGGFPAVLRTWHHLPGAGGPTGMRVFGAFVVLLAIVLMWLMARAFGIGAPLLSLALFGLHPASVKTLGTIKPYGLGIVLILASFIAVWRVTRTHPSRWRWLAVTLTLVLTLNVTYLNIVPVAVLVGAALLVWRAPRRDRVSLAAVAVAAATTLAIYVPVLRASASWRSMTYYPVTVAYVLRAFGSFLTGSATLGGIAWTVVVLSAAATWLLRWRAARSDDAIVLATLVVGTGVLLEVAFVVASHRPPFPWHLDLILALLVFGLDVALGRMPGLRWIRIAIALLAVVAFLPAAIKEARVRQTNLDLLARAVEHDASPRDVVVVRPWYFGVSFAAYYHRPFLTAPPIEDLSVQRYDQLEARALSPRPFGEALTIVDAALRSGARVWVVGPPLYPAGSPPPPLPPPGKEPTGAFEALFDTHLNVFATSITPVPVPIPAGQSVNPKEDAHLFVAYGWRGGT